MSQQLPLAEQFKALEQLQELDLKIDQLKRNKSALPQELKVLEDGLAKVKAQVDVKKNALAEIEKTQRQTRAALDINRDRLTRSSSRLDAVKNTHEFQAVSKEIEQIKKMNGTLEEQSKKSDQDAEAIQKEITELTAQFEKAQQERNARAEAVSGQGSKLDGEISALTAERSKFTGSVDPRTLSAYDRVRGARAGLGIVPAVNGRCKGCNMMVPPQMFNEIRRVNAVHSCPSCNRILYIPAEAAPQG